MIARRLATGLMLGAGLLVGAASVRGDDTVVLKRVKDAAPTVQLQRDVGDAVTEDTGGRGGFGGARGGFVGVRGGFVGFRGGAVGFRSGFVATRGGFVGVRGGFVGVRGGSFVAVRTGFVGGGFVGVRTWNPRVSIAVSPWWWSTPAPWWWYSPPVYVWPSWWTVPTVSVSTFVPIGGSTTLGSSSSFRLNLDTTDLQPPANGAVIGNETLPPPRLEPRPGQQTFPYDGKPQLPVPLPLPDPAGQPKPPADSPDEGKVVSLPTKAKLAYPAYGDKTARPPEDRTVVIKDDGKKR
jgi:hypothetical protein